MNPPESGLLAARTRFLLLIIVVLCLTINWANILAFNFTVICMTPKLEEKQLSNSTNFFNYEFSNAQKSRAMVAVAVGALLANIPVVTMINCWASIGFWQFGFCKDYFMDCFVTLLLVGLESTISIQSPL
uniref:Major facilitator superfamily (MFS) profile domain-containing protein n=1 Tax=Ditylenchus dipsaci TaxID=166011 RepID=A0A915E7B7_9BILA